MDGFIYCDACGVKVAGKDEEAILDVLMKNDRREKFKFLEHQLGVLDRKATAIVSLDGILLALTASLTNGSAIDLGERLILSTSSILVLFSAAMCAYILWTKWATTIMAKFDNIQQGFDELMVFRDNKTSFLKCSLTFLLMALIGYAFSVWLFLLI